MSAYDIYAPGSAEEPERRQPSPEADPGGGGSTEQASFLWLDEETGEELAVIVRGDEAFFRELESIGFERRDERAADARADAAGDDGASAAGTGQAAESFRSAATGEGPRQDRLQGPLEGPLEGPLQGGARGGDGADWQGRQPA